jgi:MFS family permease
MHVLAGMATPGWYDFFAKVTPMDRRGRLGGMRTSFGSLAAFLAGLLLTLFLSALGFPVNYAIGFFLGFLLQMSSIVTQSLIVEAEPSTAVAKRPIAVYLRRLPAVLRTNREFKRFMVSSVVLVIANMPIGFFTVYALKRFGAGEELVGEFTLSMMFTMVISALVAGLIADRFGNKRALIIAAVGMLLASAWALVAPSQGWFRLVFIFLGFNVGTEMMARYNISAEYGPVEERSTYIALMNTILAPFYLSGLVGGWISDQFGYPVLFGVGCLFSLAGLYLLLWRVRDPRWMKLEKAAPVR